MAVGPKQVQKDTQATAPWSIGGTLASVASFIADVDAHVTRATAIQAAMVQPKASISQIELIIDMSVSEVEAEIKVEQFRKESIFHADIFDTCMAEITKILEKEHSPPDTQQAAFINFCPRVIIAPPVHTDQAINSAIVAEYQNLLKAQTDYLNEMRQRLKADPRMPSLVQSSLQKQGAAEYWALISPS